MQKNIEPCERKSPLVCPWHLTARELCLQCQHSIATKQNVSMAFWVMPLQAGESVVGTIVSSLPGSHIKPLNLLDDTFLCNVDREVPRKHRDLRHKQMRQLGCFEIVQLSLN